MNTTTSPLHTIEYRYDSAIVRFDGEVVFVGTEDEALAYVWGWEA